MPQKYKTDVTYGSLHNEILIRSWKRNGDLEGLIKLNRKQTSDLVDQLLRVGAVEMVAKPRR